jgi:lysophospholipase L1-like esterase
MLRGRWILLAGLTLCGAVPFACSNPASSGGDTGNQGSSGSGSSGGGGTGSSSSAGASNASSGGTPGGSSGTSGGSSPSGSSGGGAGSSSNGGGISSSSSGATGGSSSGGSSGATGSSSSSSSGATGGSSGGSGSSSGGATGSSGGGSDAGAITDAALNSWYDGNAPPLTGSVTIHVVGDSTAAIFPSTDPTGRVGWASVFQPFFASGVTIDDAALSGRSSKSYIDEGHWTTVKATIRPGDYVFVEFGHNDEKTGDAARYTDPATTFRDYLRTYVNDTRAAQGFPVLLTPISRRQFSGNTLVDTHGAYPAAMIAVGQETGTPVIDMTERTRVWLENLGPTASVPLFATGDNTHLSATGAPQVAQLVVDGIRALNLPIVARLK